MRLVAEPAINHAAERAADSGATQNSQSCVIAQPPTNSAGPVLRAGLTDVLVTGMLTRWMSVRPSRSRAAQIPPAPCRASSP